MNIPPYEVYREINIYVYEDMHTGQWGVQFDWYGRLQEAQQEEYEQPTLENKLQAARNCIDLLWDVDAMGLVGKDGTLK